MWKHPYHRSNQEFKGWNLLLPQTAVLSCYAIAIGPKDSVGLSVYEVHISATRPLEMEGKKWPKEVVLKTDHFEVRF
jgi:hypothetical protein